MKDGIISKIFLTRMNISGNKNKQFASCLTNYRSGGNFKHNIFSEILIDQCINGHLLKPYRFQICLKNLLVEISVC